MPNTDETPIVPRHESLITLVETMTAGLLASDMEGVVRFANPRLLGWLGYTWGEVVGEPTVDLGVPEHAELHRQEREAIEAGDVRIRLVVLRRKDTSTFPALVIPQRFFEEDKLVGTFSIIVDLGAVQTARRVGIEEEKSHVAEALDEIARQLEALKSAAALPALPWDPSHPDLADLSRREQETLDHLMAGERVPMIAAHMFISEHTVRNHLKSIFRKTGTGSQGELIGWVKELR